MQTIRKLADDHWEYIEEVLRLEGVEEERIDRTGFYYKTAFIHGYKHGIDNSVPDLGHKKES